MCQVIGPNTRIRVLIVDDQEVVRRAFATLLSYEDTIEVVGTIPDGQAAIDSFRSIRPDVVLMDVSMPGMSGIDAASQIRDIDPGTGIILLSAYDDSSELREFLTTDPRGKSFLLKQTLATTDELIRTIQDVAAGRVVLDPVVLEKLSGDVSGPSRLAGLTPREMEVLRLMSEAQNNAAIADTLVIETRTVEHHISNIFSKLGISSEDGLHARVQAVLAYLEESRDAVTQRR